MPRDITITLQDGSQHVYKNAPDNVTPDAVSSRASQEFGQAVTHLDGGKKDGPNMLVDAARSIPGGLAQGVAGTIGLPSTAVNFVANITRKLMGRKEIPDDAPDAATFMGLPTGGQLNKAISAPTGGYYEPKTTAGRYAETAASFAPALVGGEAPIASKLMGRVLAPAAGSQAAGALVDQNKNPNLHAALQIGGAVLGGGVVSGARTLRSALAHSDIPPELTANQFLAKALAEQNANPQTIEQNAIPNRGQLGAEAMGPSGVSMLATLGRRPGATGEALANALVTRAAAAPSRIMDDYATAAGIQPEAAKGNIDALVDAGRTAAAPLYKAALDGTTATRTPELEALMQRPIIKKAMAAAANDLRNGGEDPGAIGLHFDEAGNMTQRIDPTSAAWDLTKKALGQSVERDAFGNRLPDSKSPGNFRINRASGELTAALKDAIPGYGDALKQSGDYLSLQSAFDAGQKHILSASVTAKQVADHIADLTPAEVDAYKGGIANEIFNKAQNARLAPRILNTPAVQDKLSIALGSDKAKTFLTGVQQEIDLAKSGGRMMPGTGSITSDVLMNAGDQDMGANVIAGAHAARALGHGLSGNIVGAVPSTVAALRHFAPDLLKTGGMNTEVRNALGKALMLPPQDLAARLKQLPQPVPQSASMLGRLLSEKR